MIPLHSLVHYRSSGVCEIIATEDRTFAERSQTYYVLRPVHGNRSTLFIPVGNKALESKMRPLLSREEILQMVQNIPDCPSVRESNPRSRKEQYSAILATGDQLDLLALVHGIRQEREALKRNGKKLCNADDTAMKRAEALINDEFGVVLELPPNEVETYLMQLTNR